jgi:hypothetical protein
MAPSRRFRAMADLAADLVGPDVNFHSGTLNYIHIRLRTRVVVSREWRSRG